MATLARSGIRLARRLAPLFALLAGTVLVLQAFSVQAQADAFSVEVAVANRSDAERDAAYVAALRRVLLANSGDKTLMNRDDVRAGLAEAESYVETYRYRTPEPGSLIPNDTPVTETVRQSGEATGLLLVRFDRVRVSRLVDGAEPVGTARRARPRGDGELASDGDLSELDEDGNPVNPFAAVSSALVWLVIDDGERTIRGSDPEAQKVRERLREIAGGAGLTLVFPDTTEPGDDVGAVSGIEGDSVPVGGNGAQLGADAIRLGDEAAVRSASLRFRTDVVLTGHLSRIEANAADAEVDDSAVGSRVRRAPGAGRTARAGSGDGGWQGDWIRLAPGMAASERTRTEGERLDDTLRDGIAWLAGDPTLGRPAEYVYGGAGSDTEALVRFDGVDSLGSYADLLNLLQGAPGVASAFPKEIVGDTMVFAVLPRSALGGVASAVSATAWLRRSATPVDEQASDLVRNAELAFDVLR